MFIIQLIFILCPVLLTANAQQNQGTIGYYGTSNVRLQRPGPGPIYRARPPLPPRHLPSRTTPAAYTRPQTLSPAPKPWEGMNEVTGHHYQGTVYNGTRRQESTTPASTPWTRPYKFGGRPYLPPRRPVSSTVDSTSTHLPSSPVTVAPTPTEVVSETETTSSPEFSPAQVEIISVLNSEDDDKPEPIDTEEVETDKPLINPPVVSHYSEPSSSGQNLPQLLPHSKANFTCRDGGYHPVPNECESYIDCRYFIAMKYYCQDGFYFNPALGHSAYPCSHPAEVQCTPGVASTPRASSTPRPTSTSRAPSTPRATSTTEAPSPTVIHVSEQQYQGPVYNAAAHRYRPRPPPPPRRQLGPSTPVRSPGGAFPARTQPAAITPVSSTSAAPPVSAPVWQGGRQYQGTVYNDTRRHVLHVPAPLPESSTSEAPQVILVSSSTPATSYEPEVVIGRQLQGTVINGTSAHEHHVPAPLQEPVRLAPEVVHIREPLPRPSVSVAPPVVHISSPRPTSTPPAVQVGGHQYQGTVYNGTNRQVFHVPARLPEASHSAAPWTPPYRPGGRPVLPSRRPISSSPVPARITSPRLPPVTVAPTPAVVVSPQPHITESPEPVPASVEVTSHIDTLPEPIDDELFDATAPTISDYETEAPVTEPEPITYVNVQPARHIRLPSSPRPISTWRPTVVVSTPAPVTTRREYYHPTTRVPLSRPTTYAKPLTNPPTPSLPPVDWYTTEKSRDPETVIVNDQKYQGTVFNSTDLHHVPVPLPEPSPSVISRTPSRPNARPLLPPRHPVSSTPRLSPSTRLPPVTIPPTTTPEPEVTTFEIIPAAVDIITAYDTEPEPEPETEREPIEFVYPTVEPIPVSSTPRVVNILPNRRVNLRPTPPRPHITQRPPVFSRMTPTAATTPTTVTTRRVYYPPSKPPTPSTVRVPQTRATTPRPHTNPPIQAHITWSTEKPVTSRYTDPLSIDYTCKGNGFYAVPNECDTYIECAYNEAYKHWCPDGLHFNPAAKYNEYPCAYPSEVKCTPGAKLQSPKSTEYCPQQYGYFALNDGDCSQYVSCQDGLATIMNCPPGLVFNETISTCDWPINVQSCKPNVFKDFTCPAPPVDQGVESDIILNYRYGRDCSQYIACQHGHPRLLSCDPGSFFDDQTQSCIEDYLVTDCDYATPY